VPKGQSQVPPFKILFYLQLVQAGKAVQVSQGKKQSSQSGFIPLFQYPS